MPFTSLMMDSVELKKPDGTTVDGLRASVQGGSRIYMEAGNLPPIEVGDVIVRKLSTGAREAYRVVDPCFYEAFHGIPANYQMKVQRIQETPMSDEISEERRDNLFRQWEEWGLDVIKGDLATGGHRYIGGPPATRKLAAQWVRLKEDERERNRMGVHVSGPNARVNINSHDQSTNLAVAGDLFGSLRETIERGIPNDTERARIVELVGDLEAAKDRGGFLAAYQRLIASAADHMTILAPFLPALAQLWQS
jgi:hypothetical protein